MSTSFMNFFGSSEWVELENTAITTGNQAHLTVMGSYLIYGDTNGLKAFSLSEGVWSQAGDTFPLNLSDIGQMAECDDTHIVVTNGGNDSIRKYNFDGTDFTLVGAAFEPYASWNAPGVGKLTDSLYVISDNIQDDLDAVSFNGSTWSFASNTFPLANVNDGVKIAGLDSGSIAIISKPNSGVALLRKYDFDGTDFTLDGSLSITGTTISRFGFCALTSTRVVILDMDNNTICAYDHNGTTWQAVGLAFPTPTLGSSCAMTRWADDEVIFVGQSDGKIRRYKFLL